MIRAVLHRLFGRRSASDGVEQPAASSRADSVEELLAVIDARWHSSELQLQHARRRIADIVVTRRALGDEIPDAVRESLDAAQAELQAAVDESALSVERVRRDSALLKTRLHVAETRSAIHRLRDEMDAADARMEATLQRVSGLVASQEALIQAHDELAE